MMRYVKVRGSSGIISLKEAFYDNDNGSLLHLGDEIVCGYSEQELINKLEQIIKDVKRFETINTKDVEEMEC